MTRFIRTFTTLRTPTNIFCTNHGRLAAIAGIAMCISACANYAVSVNERTVYSPPSLLNNINTSDPALTACVTQTIKDLQITQPEQLIQLNCSSAGIRSVAGLDHFSQLQRLQLSNNKLVDITPLSLLAELTELNLSNNQIINITPLRALTKLTALNLQNNPEDVCKGATALRSQIGKNLQLPSNCSDDN